VKGNITAEDGKPGTLVLSENGRVEGEIRVPHIVINGAVVGPVRSTEYVELQGKANVTGDVHYNAIEMQLGAIVQGALVHKTDAKSEKVVPLKSASSEQT
jgi:cytoskeletal protein CcmA (bactofilin family)